MDAETAHDEGDAARAPSPRADGVAPERVGPTLSVVVPVYAAPAQLERCLTHLAGSSLTHTVLVVDDASPDAACEHIARAHGAQYLRLARNGGPGPARNAGAARAATELVAFVDADVLVRPDTLERLRDVFVREPHVVAAFGSYDDAPDAPGVVTEYRNLLHHHVHQTGAPSASTFWAGCGAVRRDVFLEHGGFDPAFRVPSVEDIELGMRLRARGFEIRLDPTVLCKHLKRWTLREVVRTDVMCRAIPWTRLLIERPGVGAGDLNLQAAQRASVAFVLLVPGLAFAVLPWAPAALGLLVAAPVVLGLVGAAGDRLRDARLERVLVLGTLLVWAALLAASAVRTPALLVPIAPLAGVLWLNRRLYAFFFAHRGPGFGLTAVTLHLLYYVYSGAAFLYAHVRHRIAPVPAGAGPRTGRDTTAEPSEPR